MSYHGFGVFCSKNMVSSSVNGMSRGSQGAARGSSILSHFCIPFLPAPFSITPSSSTEWTFNYSFDQHAHSRHSSLDGSHIHMEWKYGKNQAIFFFFFLLEYLLNVTPPPSLQLCVCDIMRNRFFREEMKGLVSRGKREIRGSVSRPTTGQSPSTTNRPTQQLVGLHKNPQAGHITAPLHQCLLAC